MNSPPIDPSESSRATLRWWVSRLMTPVLVFLAGVAIIVAAGVAQRAGWISGGGANVVEPGDHADSVFTCPMHPQIRQPTKGRCPICGMELVLAGGSSGSDLDEFSIKIEPAQRRLANIQTHQVQFSPLASTVHTIGSIAIDESRMATIASYFDGRIEQLFADYTGVQVDASDHLAVVYSGELYSAQVEYLQSREAISRLGTALPAVREAQEKLLANTRRKLQELGLREAQISDLEATGTAQSRQTIYAPMGGTVVEKLVVEGKYVKAGEPIYRIADLSTVWLKLELYPENASRIRFGQLVEAHLPSLPGETFSGRVAFVDPTVNEKKRTVGVRVEFSNDQGKLRPGDYADATIQIPIGQLGEVYDAGLAGKWISPMHPQIIRDTPGDCPICGMKLVSTARYGYTEQPIEQPAALWVPRSAVLMAGSNSVVYVEAEEGRFEIRSVTLGQILRDKIVIVEGLEAGEQVATSGNFLIDSQMQLSGKPSLIDPTRAQVKRERKVPLTFKDGPVTTLAGEAGDYLETLFAAYFQIQRTLTNDNPPTEPDATKLHQTATWLATNSDAPSAAKSQLAKIAVHSEHLHHLELSAARLDAFRPLSHAVIRLAATARGENADSAFYQMFCPMVAGGEGDWLQPNSDLRNPYFGSQMLQCGEVVRTISIEGHVESFETGVPESEVPEIEIIEPGTSETGVPKTPHEHGGH